MSPAPASQGSRAERRDASRAAGHDFEPSPTFDGSRGKYCLTCGQVEGVHGVTSAATIPPKVVPEFDWTTPEGQWMAWANNEMGQLKLRIRNLEAAIPAAIAAARPVPHDERGG